MTSQWKKIVSSVTAAMFLFAMSSGVFANPSGGKVTTGTATITQDKKSKTMTITQSTDTLGINWKSFNIGANEKVIFSQPSATSIALNRVLGRKSSAIYGQLIANGKVFLINPNGILFAPTAQVNVGSLVASTLNITNSDLLAENYTFTGTKGSVTNEGSITASDGGYVVLLGNQVANQEVIVANTGTVALGAGNAITLDIGGDSLVNLAVNQAAVKASVANGGTIQADGGKVVMTNQAVDTLIGTVVNNSGVIQAKSININAAGDVSIIGTVNMNSTNSALVVSANRDININGAINANGDNTAIELRADKNGSSTGSVNFGSSGSVNQRSTGTTTIYYNPLSYVAPSDYLSKVHGGALTAYMLVNDVFQLQNINTNLKGIYALGKDIDASATSSWNDGAGLVPIGSLPTNISTYEGSFTGKMNGDSHVINNLTIYRPNESYVGLFGVSTGTITNIGLTNESITGYNHVGGLVGANGFGDFGSLSNSFSTGLVTGNNYVGGLAGGNYGGISKSFSTNMVNGVDYVGGFAGFNAHIVYDNISDSYSTGSVVGRNYVGGFVGANYVYSGIINSYSTGAVNGANYVGGFTGYNDYGDVAKCYSLGAVEGSQTVGGLVGYNGPDGGVWGSHSTGSVNGSRYVGGLVGSNMGFIASSYSTGAVNGQNYVGGLVGSSNIGIDSYSIIGSYSTGAVTGTTYVGGLVGSNYSEVNQSYSTSAVTGTSYVGGLIGLNDQGSLQDSYCLGAVNGTEYVGGLVGYNKILYNYGSISNSYSAGVVMGTTYVGGLIGFNDLTYSEGNNISNSYWNVMTSGQQNSASGIGLNTDQMRDKTSYIGWDFVTKWDINSGTSYPSLRFQVSN